jgi:peptidoglycan/xylan/chitin deacetylase (PgdA/CDA1 family)
MRSAPLALAMLAAACRAGVDDLDGIFYDGDGRLVHCAVNLDSSAGNSLASLDDALDRAAARGEVVELYAHRPGATVPHATIEHVLAGAQERGLAFVTYADFAAGGGRGPGLALSFDDAGITEWMTARPLFLHYGARVTFFVTRYHLFTDEGRAQLRQLAGDGHDIAAHAVAHHRAPLYVEERGLAAYLAEEALPSIEVLRADGYEVTSFAYPYGARTEEIDRALAAHVPILRSVAFPVHGPVGPCPR